MALFWLKISGNICGTPEYKKCKSCMIQISTSNEKLKKYNEIWIFANKHFSIKKKYHNISHVHV